MKHLICFLLIIVTAETGIVSMAIAADGPVPNSSSIKSSLNRRAFPWYDSKKDAYRPVTPAKVKESTPVSSPKVDLPDALPISQVLLWLVLIVFIGTILYLVFRHFDGFEVIIEKPQSTVQTHLSIDAIEALPEPTRKINDLLGEAERLASLSNFESAIAFYFGWQLVQLDRRHFIELSKGKTNRQYARELARTQSNLTDAFRSTTRLFEEAFFGGLPVSREDFNLVWEHRKDFEVPAEGKRR